ncbi:MAG: (4Fe-4S)-binding protein [Bacteroidota bacterium]
MAKEKEYTNGEVTIVWKPELCTHSKNCITGLPAVFEYGSRPWIKPDGASTEEIVAQVKKCPSGALTTYLNVDGKPDDKATYDPTVTLKILPNGPVLVNGAVHMVFPDGSEEDKSNSVALCRCGASTKKPFCDGSHNRISFEG